MSSSPTNSTIWMGLRIQGTKVSEKDQNLITLLGSISQSQTAAQREIPRESMRNWRTDSGTMRTKTGSISKPISSTRMARADSPSQSLFSISISTKLSNYLSFIRCKQLFWASKINRKRESVLLQLFLSRRPWSLNKTRKISMQMEDRQTNKIDFQVSGLEVLTTFNK